MRLTPSFFSTLTIFISQHALNKTSSSFGYTEYSAISAPYYSRSTENKVLALNAFFLFLVHDENPSHATNSPILSWYAFN